MKQYNVGIIGATGMVGQRFATLLENHPWFNVKVLAASPRSAGQTYEQAAGSRWKMAVPMPAAMKDMVLMDATNDIEKIAGMVDFCFCAVDMKKDEIKALEEAYAKAECPIVSNNSAHRFTPDVPMVVPEINPEHIEIIKAQRERLGTKRGFIAVKSNCSIQSYVPALHPLRKFGLKDVLACTYQAISGAGKNFETWPEMVDNLIPFIGGEEEKSEQEPLKVWGEIKGNEIVKATAPNITTQCLRVPVSDGHPAAVFVNPPRKRYSSSGRTSRAFLRSSSSPALRSSSYTTSRRITVLRLSSTETSKAVWLYQQAVSVRILSTTTSSFASPTILSEVQQAAAFSSLSSSQLRDTLTKRGAPAGFHVAARKLAHLLKTAMSAFAHGTY